MADSDKINAMSEVDLDDIDLKIIRALQVSGRMSNVELAQQCGLSPSSMLERVRRLERGGVIEGYTARVNPRALGHNVVVFIQVTMREHGQKAVSSFEQAVAEIPQILECHQTAGDFDFLLKALVEDVAELRGMLMERFSALPGISRVHTTLVLATSKHVLDIPIG